MSWDERIVERFAAVLRRRRGRKLEARGVDVAAARGRLSVLASVLAGRRLDVAIAEGPGGVCGDLLVLPPYVATFADADANVELLQARIVMGAVMARATAARGPHPAGQAAATFAAMCRARQAIAVELPGGDALIARCATALLAQRPAVESLSAVAQPLEAAAQLALGADFDTLVAHAQAVDPAWLAAIGRGEALTAPARATVPPVVPLAGWLGVPVPADVSLPPPRPDERTSRGGTDREGRARDQLRRRTLDESKREENPLVHSFEKVHTLEKYKGGHKRVDGADELEAHGDALDELELDEVVRSQTATAGVYRADLVGLEPGGAIGDDAPAVSDGIAYDEWDAGVNAYRRAWCVVRVETEPVRAPPATTARIVAAARVRHRRERNELAAQIARLDAQPRRLGRQPDGDDIDLDAVVERFGALRGGSTGPEKLYVATRRLPPDLAVTLLLDRSLSSDAWVAGQRVLDVAVAAMVALGDALGPTHTQTSIFAFASHTRRDCRMALIKPSAAAWPLAYARLAALEPAGYTRIGPALRHATADLALRPARRKLLVLLSDGKPTDYDRYEGTYGIGDVQRAVVEAHAAGVHVFALALDGRARGHLPKMFGRSGFAVVSRPRDLVVALGSLYRDLLAG